MGVSPNHPIIDGFFMIFHYKLNQPFWGSPIYGNPVFFEGTSTNKKTSESQAGGTHPFSKV